MPRSTPPIADHNPNSHSQSSTHAHHANSEWLLDPNSGLYWNSIHGVWAKYEAGQWSYADQGGKPVDGSSFQPASASVAGPPKSPHRRRDPVVYEDVYEGEEGEVAQCTGEHAARPAISEDGEEEEGELSGVDEGPHPVPALPPARPHPLRLLLLPQSRTVALEPTRTLLVLEPGRDEPMVVGRDRTFGPTLRLREMEVSKTHATVFWHAPDDALSHHGWFIVDNASTHGTFLGPSIDKSGKLPVRLAEPKKASKPFRLSHLDTICIASATEPIVAFEVHLHPRFPSSCQSCALLPDESNRLSLDPSGPGPAPPTGRMLSEPPDEEGYSMSPADVKAGRERKRKQEMARLRTQFFGPAQPGGGKRSKKRERVDGESDEPGPVALQYVDRAKLRRQTHGRTAVAPSAAPAPEAGPPAEPEQPMARGAAMLAKLAGGTEGVAQMGKVVEAKTMGSHQAGLGSREMVVGVEKVGGPKNWREETRVASYRRYGAS